MEEADGRFRIVKGVARDRVISTVDPDARHGHKTAARGFDGYKGHIALDPDSELITATDVTAGNAPDGNSADALLSEWLQPPPGADTGDTHRAAASDDATRQVYGDTAYGTAHLVELLEAAHIEPLVRVPSPSMRDGKYTQEAFTIDHEAGTVRCPAGHVATLRERKGGSTIAAFAPHCTTCSLKDACTSATVGRRIHLHPQHATLARRRQQQLDPQWKQAYRHTRPKVERKIGHLMRRRHGGRRSRVRGRARVGHDFSLLAAGVNLKRLAVLGVRYRQGMWALP